MKNYSISDMYKKFVASKVNKRSSFYTYKKGLYVNSKKETSLLTEEIIHLTASLNRMEALLEKETYNKEVILSIGKIKTAINSKRKGVQRLELEDDDIKVIDYFMFRDIITIHNKKVTDKIIEGKMWYIGQTIGNLRAIVSERNHKKKTIDFNASKLRKKALLESGVKEEDIYHSIDNPDGEVKATVYRVDDSWCGVVWEKSNRLENSSFYKFNVATNNLKKNGFKNRFSQAIMANPSIKNRYKKTIPYGNL